MNKYFTLYNRYRLKIEEGDLKAGDKLPSEKEIMEDNDLSRDTVRKALNLLVENGYIAKIKGKGSFVLDSSKFDFPVAGLISFKEMAGKVGFAEYSTEVLELSIIRGVEKIMEELKVDREEPVWKVMRVRKINGCRVILDKDYFIMGIVEHLTKEICEDSIYEYLEKELNLRIGYARKEIVIEFATEEDRKNLDLGEYEMVAIVNTSVYLQNGTLFQYTQSRHRPDKFRFVDVARRNFMKTDPQEML